MSFSCILLCLLGTFASIAPPPAHSSGKLFHPVTARLRSRASYRCGSNCVTSYLTGLPVCSFVLYLWDVKNIVEPPYRVVLDNGQLVHQFYYENIFLWEVPPERLQQKGLEGLLPLLPLTKDANKARDEVVDDMIKRLQAAGKEDILVNPAASMPILLPT